MDLGQLILVPPSGGSLEIGNGRLSTSFSTSTDSGVPPSGGSLEIGNAFEIVYVDHRCLVPPSGGSLEIGNLEGVRGYSSSI